jgi:hypothetical protein
MSLPPLSGAPDRATLTDILSTLFEPSAALRDELVPAVLAELSAPPPTYNALVHACAAAAAQWSYAQKSDFVSGHPMIGEVGGLSALSAREQASKATRPVVLER